MLANFFWTDSQNPHAMHGEHDPWLVLLSLGVSVIASGQALRLAAFARSAVTPQLRIMAIVSGSLSLGVGIWAMHFIGMLAFSLHTSVQYDLTVTVLSILPGIAASAVALALLVKPSLRLKELVLGGLIVGCGIATMHYFGMSAMRMHGTPQYSPIWFAISLAVGALLAMLALWVRFGLAKSDRSLSLAGKTAAAVIMGCAIAGMHYTAMLALRMPEMHVTEPAATNDSKLLLALTIALVTLVIGGFIAQANALLHYRARWQMVDLNESRLSALVQMAADGIICIDTKGVVLDYNPAAEAIFGWSAQEVIGQNVKMLMPLALSSQHDEYLHRHEQGQQRAEEPLRNKISEVLGQHKEGGLIPLRLALSQAEARGKRMYVGVLTDLSGQKKTDRQLRIAATVFDHSYEGVVVLDANRRVIDVNPAYERMSGISRGVAKNKEFTDLYADRAGDMASKDIWTEIVRKSHWQGLWPMRNGLHEHQLSMTAVRDDQQRLHHYIVICYQSVQANQEETA